MYLVSDRNPAEVAARSVKIMNFSVIQILRETNFETRTAANVFFVALI